MRAIIIPVLAACVACSGSTQPTQRIVLAPAPPPGPWAALRQTLDDCSRSLALAGTLEVRLSLDHRGKVVAVDSAYGSPFAACVGNALLPVSYQQYPSQILAITFTPT